MSNYTAEEQVVRKSWLWSTIASYLIIPGIWFLIVAAMTSFSHTDMDSEFVGTCFACGLAFFFLYVCAYRKPGRKYLIWNLIGTPIAVLSILSTLAEYEDNLFMWFMCAAQIGMMIWWFRNSINLLEINKKIALRISEVTTRRKGKTAQRAMELSISRKRVVKVSKKKAKKSKDR